MHVVHACRVQEHTLLTNETVYTHAYFPIDIAEDYYIVGFATDVKNAVHLHHFVVYLCTEAIDTLYDPPRQAGFPQQPASEEENGVRPIRSILWFFLCHSQEIDDVARSV